MTAPVPTGRLVGNDLLLVRTFRAPIEDVWASLTNPESTARWFGPWRWADKPGPGNPIVEFYLDLLAHSRDGRAFRRFDEYYPSQKPYYLEQAAAD